MSPRTTTPTAQSPTGKMSESWEAVKFGAVGSDDASLHSEASSSRSPCPSNPSNPSLHDNLMRRQRDRDPMLYYELVQVLGFGSMGSVSKVKKRDDAIGGSSRQTFVRNLRSRDRPCFSLLGPFFRICGGEGGGGVEKGWINGWMVRTKEDLFASQNSVSSTKTPQNASRVLSRQSSLVSDHTDIYYALKTIHLDRITDEDYVRELRNEMAILSDLDHPNIVREIETFDFKRQLFMVIELCSGGDLYCRDPYDEDDAARIVGSILSAVEYMHARNVVHRDLKYENVMFVSDALDSDVKIIDFGLSKKYAGACNEHLHDGVGTIYTMAPEVMVGDYTSQADLWSVGVIAFMLLSSQMPFFGPTRESVVEKILNCNYRMKGNRWKRVSPYAKGMVMELLQADPGRRPTAETALLLPWMRKAAGDISGGGGGGEAMDNIQEAMRNFAGYSTLKKMALMVVAHKSTNEEIGFLREAFMKFESHGEITFDEFEEALAEYGYSDEVLREMFFGANLDGTGVLKYTEFVAATLEALGPISEERVAEAFDRIDSDDDGVISTEDLHEFLGQHLPDEYLDEVIDEADSNHDHLISYRGFAAMWDEQQCDFVHDVLPSGRDFFRSNTGVTASMTDSDRDSSTVSLPQVLTTNTPPGKTAAKFLREELTEPDDVLNGGVQFRQKKELSIRRYESISVN